MRTMIRIAALAGALVCTAAGAAQSRPPTAEARIAIQACESSVAGESSVYSSNACALAYDASVENEDFRGALRYAKRGCERYHGSHFCRLAAALPELMARQGVAVPEGYAVEVVRLADFVCLSGARLYNIIGKDDTGISCDYYARQFVRRPRYRDWYGEPPDLLEAHLAALERPQLALRLYEVACGSWGYAPSCESAAALAGEGESAIARRRRVTDAVLDTLEAKVDAMRAFDDLDASEGRSLAAYAQGTSRVRAESLNTAEAISLRPAER